MSTPPTPSDPNTSATQPHEDDEHLEEDPEAVHEWDEGGPSHCGYNETVHATLMSVGAAVHAVVGEPSEKVNTKMIHVGNWFQEASYATRDFIRGDQEVNDDAGAAYSSMKDGLTGYIRGDKDEEKTGDGTAAQTNV